MPQRFNPRHYDDEPFFPDAKAPKLSKWPATRVLGWVIAIGGLSVAVNVVSVVVVCLAMARMDATHSANEQLRSDVDDLKGATANLAIAVKALANQHPSDSAKGN